VPVAGEKEEHTVDIGQVEITVPETSIKIKLAREGETSKYSSAFSDPSDPVMKGFVSIDASEETKIGDEYVLVPLFVTYGGTGQFINVALLNAKTNQHLGSVFVGDRIDIGSIEVRDMIAKVNYKTRLDTEAMAADPTIPAQLVVEVKDNMLKEIMRLQNADYNEVEIKSPAANSTISGDFVIRGSMPGSWYFEANAQLRIIDASYQEIAIGSVQALSDWMTTQRVPFEVKMNTSTLNTTGKATIIISSENVQGDEDGARKVKKMEVPVVIK
jgi:hypothetical protein